MKPEAKTLREQIKERLEAMYFSAQEVINYDEHITDPPIPLEEALSYHLPALEALIATQRAEAAIEGQRELIGIAAARARDDDVYTLRAFAEDAEKYVDDRLKQLKEKP